ncbi:hypothetical protein [Mycobacterium tilburgii]|uniref:hypothetical protein n=1 Tax=Mycobacterium tilburgii TaxID=44467 RepID=UPI003898E956
MDAVAAEVAAALRISQGLAASRLRYAPRHAGAAATGRGGLQSRRYRLSDVSKSTIGRFKRSSIAPIC